MFLSIMTLLQTNLPCSVNYYRYKNNYEKYVGDGDKKGEGEVIKTIASPRLMSKLSPVANLVKNQNINVNPMSQKGLLKYAVNKPTTGNNNEEAGDSDSDDDQDFSKFGSKKLTAEQKKAREKELAELKAKGLDNINNSNAVRLPNRISKGMQIDSQTGTAKMGNDRDVIMSPTSFLSGAASPRLNTFLSGAEENCV